METFLNLCERCILLSLSDCFNFASIINLNFLPPRSIHYLAETLSAQTKCSGTSKSLSSLNHFTYSQKSIHIPFRVFGHTHLINNTNTPTCLSSFQYIHISSTNIQFTIVLCDKSAPSGFMSI